MTHTPGPWKAEKDGISGEMTIRARDPELPADSEFAWSLIAYTYKRDDDARLIATAPELLAELQELVRYLETATFHPAGRQNLVLGRARAAIAKATGE